MGADRLPPDSAGFIGRDAELDRLRHPIEDGRQPDRRDRGDGGVARLILPSGRNPGSMRRVRSRGCCSSTCVGSMQTRNNPGRPGRSLDGFLRLLGVPANNTRTTWMVAHALPATGSWLHARGGVGQRCQRGAGPPTPAGLAGLPHVVTSRRSLTELGAATHLTVRPYTRRGVTYLMEAVPRSRLAQIRRPSPDRPPLRRLPCPCLGQPAHPQYIRWTMTDHADRPTTIIGTTSMARSISVLASGPSATAEHP